MFSVSPLLYLVFCDTDESLMSASIIPVIVVVMAGWDAQRGNVRFYANLRPPHGLRTGVYLSLNASLASSSWHKSGLLINPRTRT